MGVNITQRNATRNQSFADFEQKKIFLFDNRFSQGTLTNNSDPEVTWTLQSGMPLFRATDGSLTIIAAYGSLVGVLAIDGTVDLVANDSLDITYCDKGTVDGGNLVLPGSDTLNTVASGLSVKDHLQNIGLHVESVSENTNFDN